MCIPPRLIIVFCVAVLSASDLPRLGVPPRAPERSSVKGSNLHNASATALGPTSWYDTSNRSVVQAAYNTVFAPTISVQMGWTGSQLTGVAGTTAQAYKDAVVTRISWFRAMAGVPPTITLNSTFNAKAQQAALMMSANGQLSHSPPSSWQFYTADGAEAAGNSNLCLGFLNDPGCVAAYMHDDGSNNAAVGHRRWILYPQTQVMGTGDVARNGSYSPANAMWVFDSNAFAARPATRETQVAWPPKGYVPYQVIPKRWSFSYPDADFSSATVTMQKDGANVGVQLETVHDGYGENTLVWLPAGFPAAAPSTDVTYTVNVNNARINGTLRNFTYAVTIFNPAITPSGSGACPGVSINSISTLWQGEAGTVSISAPASCFWTASSAAPWVQVYPLSGSGSGTLQYTVYPQFGTAARSGSIAVNAASVSVTQAGNTGTSNERFAGLMYFNYFGRVASSQEIAFQASVLNAGGSRTDMAYNFFQTQEFNAGGRFVAGLYVGLLDRDAEYSGWLFQRNALATQLVNQTQIVTSFMAAAEYKLKFGEPLNPEFVRLLYRYILLREAGQSEADFQVAALTTGLTRTQLASNFLNSQEFRVGTGSRLFAFLLYSTLFQRDSTTSERSGLAGRLESGLSPKSAIAEFLASSEHTALLQ